MHEKETVCSVVVTYNRKKLLLECIESLRNTRSLTAIYLIDNASTDGTPQALLKKRYINEAPPEVINKSWETTKPDIMAGLDERLTLHYVRLSENTGGAGGFHEGVKRAYEKGYDWLWLMDDDAESRYDTLENMLAIAKKKNIKAVCPLILGENNLIQRYHHKRFDFLGRERTILGREDVNDLLDQCLLIKEDANAFVGLMVHRNVVRNIGFPMKELFIWGDDTEYTLRISKYAGLYLFTGALIKHKDKNYAFQKALPREHYWKVYYAVRNRLWIYPIHFGLIPRLFMLVKTFLSLFDPAIDYELKKIKFSALMDGLFRRP